MNRDIIYKHEAIDALLKLQERMVASDGILIGISTARKEIESMSPVTTNDLWTPCSVTLPLKEDVYLVTGRNGTVSRLLFSDTDASKKYWHRAILAWMPIPKAYKGGNNG